MLQELRRQWFMKQLWGSTVEAPPEFNEAMDENIAKVLLTCVNGDGQITQAERDWIFGFLSSAGFSNTLVDKLLAYSADEEIVDLIAEYPYIHASPGMIIYTSILACDSDDELHPEEVATIRRMAHAMGAADELVNELLAIVEEEKQLKAKRIQLVFPKGVPF